MSGQLRLEIRVSGLPAPQGSKTIARGGGKVWMREVNDERQKSWRREVTDAAAEAWAKAPALLGPLTLCIAFTFPRLKGHFRSGARAAELREGAPRWKDSQPDLSKLVRAVEDSLTYAGIWRDDAQVACLRTVKGYGDRPGAVIQVWEGVLAW
jgi:Holliday junction resolvase RusA-like endonuclease